VIVVEQDNVSVVGSTKKRKKKLPLTIAVSPVSWLCVQQHIPHKN